MLLHRKLEGKRHHSPAQYANLKLGTGVLLFYLFHLEHHRSRSFQLRTTSFKEFKTFNNNVQTHSTFEHHRSRSFYVPLNNSVQGRSTLEHHHSSSFQLSKPSFPVVQTFWTIVTGHFNSLNHCSRSVVPTIVSRSFQLFKPSFQIIPIIVPGRSNILNNRSNFLNDRFTFLTIVPHL